MAPAFRFLLMLLVWLVITGGARDAWLPGLLVAAAAAALGLRLLPPHRPLLRWAQVPLVALQFVRGSLAGGIDVARRALHPRGQVRPGWIRQPLGLPPGPGRKAFTDMISLMPGTLPAGDDGEVLLVHCIDGGQEMAQVIAGQERAFGRALGLREPPGG